MIEVITFEELEKRTREEAKENDKEIVKLDWNQILSFLLSEDGCDCTEEVLKISLVSSVVIEDLKEQIKHVKRRKGSP